MKTFLIALWLLTSNLALAQTSRTDVLYKVDQSMLNVKIDELTDTDVVYFESTAPTVKKTIARAQVWKIVFRDGSTEIITAQPGQIATTDQIILLDQSVVVGKVGQRDKRKLYYTKPNDPTNAQYELLLSRLDRIRYADGREEIFRKVISSGPSGGLQGSVPTEYSIDQGRKIPNNPYKGLTVFLHGSGTQIMSENDWKNANTGNGFTQGVGGDIQVQYRFSRGIALALTASHTIWKVRQNYIDSTTSQTLIRWDYQLTHSEALLILKLYPVRSIYVALVGGIALVRYETRHGQPDNVSWPVVYQSYNPVVGASLGSEFRIGSIQLDVNAFGRYVVAKELGVFQPQPVLRAGIRLGIGFSFTK